MSARTVQEAAKSSMRERYGVDYAAQCPGIYRKVQESKLRKYGNATGSYDKLRRHFTPELAERIRLRTRERYGVDYPLQNAEIYEKSARIGRFRAQGKAYGRTSSDAEDRVWRVLCGIFGENDVYRHYKSEAYPFYCDFFVKSRNLYVEYNGFWMHSGRPFDPGSADDAAKAAEWREKGAASKTYAAALRTWTERDPLKRRTAEAAGVGYVELWDMAGVHEWVNGLRKDLNGDD